MFLTLRCLNSFYHEKKDKNLDLYYNYVENEVMPSNVENTVMAAKMAAYMQSMAEIPTSMSSNMTSGLQFNLDPAGPTDKTNQTITAAQNTNTNNPVVTSTDRNVPVNRMESSTGDCQQTQTSRSINIASLCRIGQETVQDIVSRAQEVFQNLKTIQAPKVVNTRNDKRIKVQNQLRAIRILFKRLRLIFEKCNDNTLKGMEYTHIESRIPIKNEYDNKVEECKSSETYRSATEEYRGLCETVSQKNIHLKDIVDQLRRIILEVNTMLMMKRS